MSSWNNDLSQKVERFSIAGPSTGGFWANVRIIRPVAWVIAVIGFLGMEAMLWFLAFPEDAHSHHPMQLGVKIFLSTIGPVAAAVLILFPGYVYSDAKRRRMRAGMWTVLAVFVPYLIGVILYFLLREPLPTPCPKCGFMARQRFAFCPQCSTPLNRVCATCARSLEHGWSACAYCGTPVTGPVAGRPDATGGVAI
jgi:Double zinc ribbon